MALAKGPAKITARAQHAILKDVKRDSKVKSKAPAELFTSGKVFIHVSTIGKTLNKNETHHRMKPLIYKAVVCYTLFVVWTNNTKVETFFGCMCDCMDQQN